MSSKSMGGDRVYVERFIGDQNRATEPRISHSRTGSLLAFLMGGISARYRDFLQNRMSLAAKEGSPLPEEDLTETVKDILGRIPVSPTHISKDRCKPLDTDDPEGHNKTPDINITGEISKGRSNGRNTRSSNNRGKDRGRRGRGRGNSDKGGHSPASASAPQYGNSEQGSE
ncbi:hypothetical protein VTN31DRAFT_2333 [Thermomyces dupontii]|uniref:uncharacterized protein n=1 Tax=Talaromyces thermophilus TaxID=28565 RepID=UPI0037444931